MYNFNEFKNWIDWNRFDKGIKLVDLEKNLNQSENRFAKGQYIQSVFENTNTMNNIKYVGEDETDYDFLFEQWDNAKVECKSLREMLFYKNGTIKDYTPTINLKNKLSDKDIPYLKEFDILLLVQSSIWSGVGFVLHDNIKKLIGKMSSKFEVKVPKEMITIVHKNYIRNIETKAPMNISCYKSIKEKMNEAIQSNS